MIRARIEVWWFWRRQFQRLHHRFWTGWTEDALLFVDRRYAQAELDNYRREQGLA